MWPSSRQEDVSSNVDAEVAVKGVAVNRAAGDCPAILAPKMDAIMVIGVRGGIPIGEVVKMIVVDAIAPNFAGWAGSNTVIYMVDVGIREREVVALTRKRPGGIMASDLIHR